MRDIHRLELRAHCLAARFKPSCRNKAGQQQWQEEQQAVQADPGATAATAELEADTEANQPTRCPARQPLPQLPPHLQVWIPEIGFGLSPVDAADVVAAGTQPRGAVVRHQHLQGLIGKQGKRC